MPFRILNLTILAVSLVGCNSLSRISQIGAPPAMSVIQNPVQQRGYQPISMPMPPAQPIVHRPNSLWQTGARAFFRDQRATQIGDILTVIIDLDDKAEINNTSSRSRAAGENAALSSLLGYEAALSQILPDAVNNANLVDAEANSTHNGAGSIARGESIEVKVAAVITQILPNGNLVIHGRQEVRVNFEMRELRIDGIIRSEDISSTNSIPSEKIAEARIAYGGRGQITDVQQPRYGQQIYDIIFPF